ncbi:MAG: GNAT family N-acetyltransferase [Acidimicrobiales bacterium]|nr:GNAT family N-acetyltransferase [Acidimicrobiales bacterium]
MLCNFLVVRNGSGQVIGIVAAYQADFRNGHAYIAQYIFPDFHGVAWPLESMVIFIDYLFLVFPFRKLYGATIQNSANRFETAFGEVWIEEGRLTEHEYVNGAYVDLITVSVTRERWARHRATLEESRLLAAVEGKRPGALAMDGDKNLLRDA